MRTSRRRRSATPASNAQEAGVRSYVLLPLVAGGEAIGTFYAAWAEPRRFEPEELSFLEAVAAECATGLENARLYEAEQKAQLRARQELERTKLLQEVTTAATSSLSLPDIGQRVLALTMQALGAKSGAIYAVDEAEGVLRALALAGYSEDVAREIASVPIDERYNIGYMVAHDLPLITYDSGYTGPASEPLARRLRAEGTRWFALPIKRAGCDAGRLRLRVRGGEAVRGRRARALSQHRPSWSGRRSRTPACTKPSSASRRPCRSTSSTRCPRSTVSSWLRVAAGREPELIGGDFHDVFVLPSGTVLAFIGDVMGKGIKAAGLTETVRARCAPPP